MAKNILPLIRPLNEIKADLEVKNEEANNDLDTSVCNDCEGYSVLCVSNGNQDSYSFYSVLADR